VESRTTDSRSVLDAAIFGDGFNTELGAVGGNFLTDILPML
jgi:hypothetical protein